MADVTNASNSNKPISKIPLTLLDDESEALFECDSCGLHYRPSKSTSSLRLTYCGFLCEIGALGFSIDGLEQMEITAVTDSGSDVVASGDSSVDISEETDPVPSVSTST